MNIIDIDNFLSFIGGIAFPYAFSAFMSLLLGAALVCSATSLRPLEAFDKGLDRPAKLERKLAGTSAQSLQPIRDAHIFSVCLILALVGGTLRGCLDILVPLWLQHRYEH